MPNRPVVVQWQVAADEQLRHIARQGVVLATPTFGHSVHVEASDLDPARWYWYRFRAEGHESPIGRTRTAPLAAHEPDRLRFAFASCQNW
jgi:alkaline phosphatase D